ncbi:MAG: alpha/beta hydrolase [Marmoricola sp.]
MSAEPRLIDVRAPTQPSGVVLVLHGGAARRDDPVVSTAQPSVIRMVPIARRIARAGRGRLAVFRVLNSRRGWDDRDTPLQDVRWALGQVRQRYGDGLPNCLVGHSLGGRAALLSGVQAEVRSVVALNPWVYRDDDADLTGRKVLIVHGDADRIADPESSAVVARALSRTTDVGYIRVSGGRHAMLRHHSEFDRYATQFATATLLGDPAPGPVGQVLAGEVWVTA